MVYPNYSLEKKLIKQGYQNIVGIDEVGRGALAGPIVAVATTIISLPRRLSSRARAEGQAGNFPASPALVPSSSRGAGRQFPCLAGRQSISKKISNPKYQISKKLKIRDSKLLSEKRREKIFEELSKKVIWSVGVVTHREIDKFGITRANLLVIKRALRNLEIEPDYLLLDKVNGFKHRLPWQSIVDGDAKVLSISIASILAKVTRDRMMREFHQKYSLYGFDRHKGYGTLLHRDCLKKYGICQIHRLSYQPVRMMN